MILTETAATMEVTEHADVQKQSLASGVLSVALDGLEEICDHAFAHAIQRMAGFHPITASDAERKRFSLLCTRGHRIAQQHLIARLCVIEHIHTDLTRMRSDPSFRHDKGKRLAVEQALRAANYSENTIRMIANGIAWTLLGGQPWVLRRYYLGYPQIPLSSSNLDSAIRFVNHFQSNPCRFAFITDLTSCIQMGDLILVDHSKGFGWHRIAELKEGDRANVILDKLDSLRRGGGSEHHQGSITNLTPKDVEQIERTLRQLDRMLKTMEILHTDRGIDPISGKELHLVDSDLRLSSYDEELTSVLRAVAEKGHDVRLVEGCIWVGAFDLARMPDARRQFERHLVSNDIDSMTPHAHAASKNGSHGRRFTFADLSQAVALPQVRPFFLRALPPEYVHRILRREWAVYFHLDFDQLFVALRRHGLAARWQTKAERRVHPPAGAFVQYGRNPVVEIEGRPAVTMGDIAMVRLLYESWKVETLAKWYEQFMNYRGIVLA